MYSEALEYRKELRSFTALACTAAVHSFISLIKIQRKKTEHTFRTNMLSTNFAATFGDFIRALFRWHGHVAAHVVVSRVRLL